MSTLDRIVGPRIPHQSWQEERGRFLAPALLLGTAALLLVVSIFFPYWRLVLHAPQYPQGLAVEAYLNRLAGDVREIDGLNHYIGMRPLGEAASFERSISILAVATLALLLAGAVLVHTRWAAALSLPALGFPAFFLADLAWWMQSFGTHLDPHAPLASAIKPFVPPVLGEGRVGQFATVATPGPGLILAAVASLVVLAGLYFHRRAFKPLVDAAAATSDPGTAERQLGSRSGPPGAAERQLGSRPGPPGAAERQLGSRSGSGPAATMLLWLLLTPAAPSEAARLTVAPGGDVATLADALARAADGDTVVVRGGVHHGPWVVERRVALVGAGWPVLDGGGDGTVLRLTAAGSSIEGFVVRRSGDRLDAEDAGVAVDQAAGSRVEGNRLEDVLFGIYLRASPESVVRANSVTGKALDLARRGDAIRVWSSDGARIEDNEIQGARDVVLWYSSRLEVHRNHVTAGRYGLHFMYCDDATIEGNRLERGSVGAFLMISRRLRFHGNTVVGNHGPSGYGIGLKDMDDAEVRGNVFLANRVGAFLDNSPREMASAITVVDNLFAANDVAIAMLPNVERGDLRGNTFAENLQAVEVEGGGGRADANRWEGNYWSDYAGYDVDGDGTGDLPHRVERLFEDLTDRRPALRILAFSPVTDALGMASRAFPAVRPEPKLVDPRPRMRPSLPASLPELAGGGDGRLVRAGGGLVATAVLVLLAPGVLRRRRRAPPAPELVDALALAPATTLTPSIATPSSPAAPAPKIAPIVEARDLVKRYGDSRALDGASFVVRPGEAVALWGPNGAGKTTALRAVLGVLRCEGEVRVAGLDPWRDEREARRRIGFVAQEVRLQAELELLETLDFYARLRGLPLERSEIVVDELALAPHLGKRVGELSGGLRQRLALAVALLADPPLLVLDEPTANVDSAARADFLARLLALKRAGKAILFSSHRREEVLALADRVVVLDGGRVVADAPPAVAIGFGSMTLQVPVEQAGAALAALAEHGVPFTTSEGGAR